jgi:predicted dehydrogenase
MIVRCWGFGEQVCPSQRSLFLTLHGRVGYDDKESHLVANHKPKHSGKFRVGILGAGGIAETHAEVLRGIPDVEPVAICDMQFSKAEAFREKMGLPKAYASLDTMLAEERPDAVHLAVSPVAHARTAIECLEAGVHAFVEKPFCLTTADCDRVAATAARTGLKIGVNHNLVFNPAIARAIQAVREGKLGGIEHATIAFNVPMPELPWGPYSHWLFQSSENIVFEVGVHPLSVVNRLFGRVLEAKTLCSGEKILPSGVTFYSMWQVAMVCERGTATLLLSFATGFEDLWLHIQGEDGVCHVDIRRNTVVISEKSVALGPLDDLRDSRQAAKTISRDGFRHYKNYILASLRRKAPYPLQFASMNASIRAFYDALRNGAAPPMGAAEGSAVVHSCEMAVAHLLARDEMSDRPVMSNG